MEITTNTQASNLSQIAHDAYSANSYLLGKEEKKEQIGGVFVSVGKTNKDQATFSNEAKLLAANDKSEEAAASDEQSELVNPNQATSQSGEPLTEEEQLQLEELQRRDAEVKAHEQAHMSASGGLVRGGAEFSYENGPDGKRYAVGGEVTIDTSSDPNDPQATLIKAQKIRRAALAPSDPSSQDRSVAAEASRMEAEARMELSKQARGKQSEYIEENDPEVDFFASRFKQNEKNIQDNYKKIQNTQVLQEQRSFVDFFI